MFTGASPVQATGDVSATQPVEAPGMKRGSAASRTATQPVEAPGTERVATQPVEAPFARPDVDSQPTGTGSGDVSAVEWSLTSKRTVAATTGVSDTEDELDSEPESAAVLSDQEVLSNREPAKDDKPDQEFSEEANYRDTMRGVRSFMGWHQIPDFDSSSSSLDNNPFASSQTQPTRKVSIKFPADDWLCRKLEKLNVTIAEGYPFQMTGSARKWKGLT